MARLGVAKLCSCVKHSVQIVDYRVEGGKACIGVLKIKTCYVEIFFKKDVEFTLKPKRIASLSLFALYIY